MYLIISMIIMIMIMIVVIVASYIIVYCDCSDHHKIYLFSLSHIYLLVCVCVCSPISTIIITIIKMCSIYQYKVQLLCPLSDCIFPTLKKSENLQDPSNGTDSAALMAAVELSESEISPKCSSTNNV